MTYFGIRSKGNTMSKSKSQTKLIVAASEHDADMLYATRFFAPDPLFSWNKTGNARWS